MAFIRSKTISGNRYFYLVESIRSGKSVRQKVIRYLGAHATGVRAARNAVPKGKPKRKRRL